MFLPVSVTWKSASPICDVTRRIKATVPTEHLSRKDLFQGLPFQMIGQEKDN